MLPGQLYPIVLTLTRSHQPEILIYVWSNDFENRYFKYPVFFEMNILGKNDWFFYLWENGRW